MKYTVNNVTLEYESIGQRQWGEPVTLLNNDKDISEGTHWSEIGFTIEKLFDEPLFTTFKNSTHDLLIELWKKASLNVTSSFSLSQYHKIAFTREQHLAAVENTKLIDVKHFPVHIKLLEERISDICKKKLIVKNPFDGLSAFHFRVIRPQQPDNNPLHRDVWLDDYKNCLNLYIPITGSNEKSSLVIIPGSHHWPESRIERTKAGAEINGVRFNVPAVTAIKGHVEYLRPNPQQNEVLVFSPYLIHGGSLNLNHDSTRISIEVRLWEK
jgi:hypothetical protein